MKTKTLILGLLFSSSGFAWTLNNNFVASFKSNHVKVYIDKDTACAPFFTADEFAGIVKKAIDKYWNKVPTSNLRLTFGGFAAPIANINHGRLCSPTDQSCISSAGTDLIPSVNDIILACNDNPDNYNGSNVLAVTVPNKFSGKKIEGAVILFNTLSTLDKLSRSDQIGVVAHEIGHALGLGHSDKSEALMYYRTVDQRNRLGQDDIDGISFLYPMKGDTYGLTEDGLFSSCGTISTDKTNPPGNPPFLQVGIAMVALILITELRKLFKRS